MELCFREVAFGSAEYLQTVSLRDKVLRIPLGLKLTEDELSKEGGDIHLAAFLGDELVGCLILVPRPDGLVRMRQVAVREGLQRLGVGKRLVQYSEKVALARGFVSMVLHARATVAPFYLKLGYEVVGEEFEEVTIPHLEMRKPIN